MVYLPALARPEAQPARPESQPARSEAQKIGPFYRTLSPIGTMDLHPPMKTNKIAF